ncbi:hypothetical protein FZW96_11395 [Bacillus sp. BGMRC 2118]|nr:hypothetical protein FZW96_11395 [Bacillus sp. BGMRC 2118]
MTWVVLVSIILASLIKILLTCLPLGVVEWIMSKFEVHTKINEVEVKVTKDSVEIIGEEKKNFIKKFNEAVFMQKQYIHPGNEQNFLYRTEVESSPIMIESINAKKETKVYIYRYTDRIEVVKQYKKRVVAYSLFADKSMS